MFRDAPQTEGDQVSLLRAELRAVTDAYEDLLGNGPLRRGGGALNRDAYDAWHERAHDRIRCAREAIDITSDTYPVEQSIAASRMAKLRHPHPRLRVEWWTGQWWEPLWGSKLDEALDALVPIPTPTT